MVIQRCANTNVFSACNPAPSLYTQAQYTQAQSEFSVIWKTNLSILYGARKGGQALRLKCFVENDPAFDDGDDEIFIKSITADGEQVIGQKYVGDFDAGNDKSLESHILYTIYFFDKVTFKNFEDDGFANGDADPMSGDIPAMSPGQQAMAFG